VSLLFGGLSANVWTLLGNREIAMDTGIAFGWSLAPNAEILVSFWGWNANNVWYFDLHSQTVPMAPNAPAQASGVPGVIYTQPPAAIEEDPDPDGNVSLTYYFGIKNTAAVPALATIFYLTETWG
jgi:hypothetical protein